MCVGCIIFLHSGGGGINSVVYYISIHKSIYLLVILFSEQSEKREALTESDFGLTTPIACNYFNIELKELFDFQNKLGLQC